MTDQYTPKPGDLVQLKSGGVVMTAGESARPIGAELRTECWYDTGNGIGATRIPTAALMPAEVEEDDSDSELDMCDMEFRISRLRVALAEIITLDPAFVDDIKVLASNAIRNDDTLADGGEIGVG